MKTLQHIKGAGTALVTPFKKSGDIDEDTLRKFVDFQIDGGIDFLVPCGTTGESATMSVREHLQVVEIVISQARGRVPVIAGAGGNNTAQVIELAGQVTALGPDGLLSVTPYYNKPTQQGLYLHYKAIVESVDIPVILYDVPGRTGCSLLPDTVLKLAELPGIAGLKAASGNIAQIGEIGVRKPDDFILLSGDDPNTLPIIALGGQGVISVVSNQAPGLIHEFTALCLNGRFEEARAAQKSLLDIMRLNFLETNPVPVKAGLELMGLMEASCRLPLAPMQADNLKMLREGMQSLGLIS